MANERHPLIRSLVRSREDVQKLRIQTGNRLVANFRVKLGIAPGTKASDDKEADKILKRLLLLYDKITDGVADLNRRRRYDYDRGEGIIDTFTELSLIAHYRGLVVEEARLVREIDYSLRDVPIWTEFLADVKGIGPALGGIIVSEIDIHEAKYPSSLWKYAGLDVAKGTARSRRQEHLVDRTYVTSDGETTTRKSITYNPLLKTKLMGVAADCLLRAGSRYRDDYDRYKHRIEQMPKHADWRKVSGPGPAILTADDAKAYEVNDEGTTEDERGRTRPVVSVYDADELVGVYRQGKTKAHRHQMAKRYMVKALLRDLYNAWRPLEGLPVAPDYHEAKLGHAHSS